MAAQNCKKCLEILIRNQILSEDVKSYKLNDLQKKELIRNFRKWAIINHPDKGGNLSIFQEVSNCVDTIAKENKCDIVGEGAGFYRPPPKPEPPKFKHAEISEFKDKIKDSAIITIHNPTKEQFDILKNPSNLSRYLYYYDGINRYVSGTMDNVADWLLLTNITVYGLIFAPGNDRYMIFPGDKGDFHLLTVSSAERERLLKEFGVSDAGPKGLNKCATVVCPKGKICNPATGRCVDSKGVLGKKILASGPAPESKKDEKASSKPKPVPKSKPAPKEKASSKKPKSTNKCTDVKCPAGKICNPESGRCVSRTGAIGKKILSK